MFPSIILYSFILVCPLLLMYNTPNVSGSAEPLLLTPYIRRGEITTARQLSYVVDEEGVIPRSFAGFITVDTNVGNHFFFWLFPTLNSDPTAPLLIWLNGGPGESSMVGLFYENGPIQIEKSNSGEAIYTRRNNSWVSKFSMLYIDNPVGTGYSYSEDKIRGYRSNQADFAKDLYTFIPQFYQMFPEFRQRDLYIGGHDYAGKYVPALAYRIHQHRRLCSDEYPLKGIYLGNPVIDPNVQLVELQDLYYQLGYISYKQLIGYKKNVTDHLPRLKTANYARLLFKYTNDNFYKVNNIDIHAVQLVMDSEKLRLLLHVGKASYNLRNYDVHDKIILNDFSVSSVSKLAWVVGKYKVLIYGGDLDGFTSAPGLESVITQFVTNSLRDVYENSSRVAWTDANGEPKGFYNQASSFCRVVLRLAGHRTLIDQPDNTLEMMDQFVAHGCVQSEEPVKLQST